jgi:hypothetical protein
MKKNNAQTKQSKAVAPVIGIARCSIRTHIIYIFIRLCEVRMYEVHNILICKYLQQVYRWFRSIYSRRIFINKYR